MGPIATQLRRIFEDIVYGRHPKYRHWNTPVYARVADKAL